MKGHKKWVTSLAYCPYHINPECNLFVSGSKDKTVRVWDSTLRRCVGSSTTHSSAVTKVVWTPRDFIISCSEDRSIIVWSSKLRYIRKLGQHSHWVNCMSLSTEYLIRNSYFELKDMNNVKITESLSKSEKVAKMRGFFDKFYSQTGGEYLVTGSDDHTINLFSLGKLTTTKAIESKSDVLLKKGLSKRNDVESDLREVKVFEKFSFSGSLEKQKKVSENFCLIRRYTGHSKAINHVQFAPNGFLFISASFDKSLRVWNVLQNGCLAVLRGHVAAVYR